MPHVTANGVRLYYEEHGTGVPILCVHGTSSSALVWASAVGTLAELGRVIVYDRRGCTRSERPDPYETTSVGEHADDARALLETLDAAPAVVVGRSYGGSVALDLALRHPEAVRALVLLEALPAGLSEEADAWDRELCAAIEQAVAERGVDVAAETLLREVAGTWEELPPEWREMFTANGPAILAECRGGEPRLDAGLLARVAAPTLVVSASASPEAFRHVTEALAAEIPGAREARVAGGHIVDPTDPAVLAFLSEVTREAE
jgi:esterase